MTSALSDEIEKLVFEHAPAALVLTERRFILACNTAFCELFGYTKEELLGELILKLYPSVADFNKIGERSYSELMEASSYVDERFMQTKEGKVFWARASGRTLTPEDPFKLAVWSFSESEDFSGSTKLLSSREREVSGYIANGMTCKEIAKELGISHRTVEAHRSKVMKKLGCRNMAEMISKIVRLQ